MRFLQKIKGYLSTEISNLKPLSFRDKVWYIWEYHKFHIAVIVFVSILLFTVLGNALFPSVPYLSNAAINLTGESAQCPSLTSEAHDAMGLGKKDEIALSPFYLSFDTNYEIEHNMALQSLFVRIATRDLDLMFMPKSDFHAMETANIYTDMEQLLPKELWDAVKSYAIYVTDPATDSEYPAALDVTKVPAIAVCEFMTDSVVVCFSPTTEHLENGYAMIAYLYGIDYQTHS